METVLITGANGFLGSHLVREALAQGYRVHALVRGPLSAERVGHLRAFAGAERLVLFAGDLLDRGSLGPALAGCELSPWLVRVVTWFDPRAKWSVLQPLLGRPLRVDPARVIADLGLEMRPAKEALRASAQALVRGGYAPKARPRPKP